MPKIVQFTHPGPEHKPDKKNGNLTSWNTGKHKRKFLLTKGEVVIGNNLKEEELVFWGEWEPPSNVTALANRPNKFFPQWLHRPYLPSALPNPSVDSYQNTDPCVFDGQFKYFVCKQFKPKNKRHTPLATLDKGSLILFGSTGYQNSEEAFFQLDTVFVVSDYLEYDISDPNALMNISLGAYRNYVFRMSFPNPADFSLKLRLYFGATIQNPIEGMYSYSPAQLWNNQSMGFPRVPLKNIEFITNNLNAAPKITEASIEVVVNFWELIRDISRTNGCLEGIKFTY
jgi:hypothetical protein